MGQKNGNTIEAIIMKSPNIYASFSEINKTIIKKTEEEKEKGK